jgi:CRISPR-associated protein Csy2
LRQENPSANSVDALLDMCSLAFEPPGAPDTDDSQWTVQGKPGWIVPIPVGYGAISDLYPPGVVKNARDIQSSFRFVESLSTLGQWISPHRVADIRELLWYYSPQPDKGLYQCANSNQFNKEIQKEI